MHKLLNYHLLSFSTLHSICSAAVANDYRLRFVDQDFGVREFSVGSFSKEVLQIHFQILISEMTKVLDEFSLERATHVAECFGSIVGLPCLPCLVKNSSHSSKWSSTTVMILISFLTSDGPLTVDLSFSGLMFWNQLRIILVNICTHNNGKILGWYMGVHR